MYKQIILLILLSIMLLGTGCGILKDEEENRTNLEEQGTEQEVQSTQEIKQGAQETKETEETEETPITVTSVQVNTDTKSVCVQAKFLTAENLTATDYSVMGVQALRTDVVPIENGYNISWYGFYEEESAYQDVKIQKPFEEGQTENIENLADVEEVGAKKFDVAVGDSTVPVWITPFALLISPQEDWRLDGEFYNVIATDTQKNRYYICSLPMMDDRKPSVQKNDPLENLDMENMDELGEGLSASIEQEHLGIQSVFSDTIDPGQIEQIEIICYHK